MYEFSSFQKVDVPYQMPSTHTTFPSKLKVLIIGAGIGGLMMGALLQKGGVDFEIYERARVVKPLGSAMSMGANLAPLFKQLGLYEEFLTIGKPNIGMDLFNEQAELLFSMDFRDREVIGGAREYIVARSDFYSLLLNQVSSEKIHMGKKVVALQEHERGITIRCEDSTEYSGDILIGADGTYSTIREKLYESLKTQNRLPPSDDVTLPFSCTCLLGQTVSLDPNDFPGAGMEQEHSQFNFAIGVDNKYSWTTITTKKNTICWFVLEYLDQDASTSKGARSTGWGPGAAEAMCTEVRHLKVPCKEGGRMLTIGDLIDISPKDSISKVVLEEKVFDTWYGGRTVLLGDACHKINPAGGAGALNAMHDAAALANWICSLETPSVKELERIFEEYRKERLPRIKEAFIVSRMLRDVGGKTYYAAFIRALFKWMPRWAWRQVIIKGTAVRSQVSFLPLVEDVGEVSPIYQTSLHRTRERQQQNDYVVDMREYNVVREKWSRL